MDIKSASYLISSPSLALCPKPDRPEYAFIGRSNVGKSSLINMLTRNAHLAKTSAAPGKTQMINHFDCIPSYDAKEETPPTKEQLLPFWFVDLPGYGFAKRSQTQRAEWKKMIAGYLQARENLITTFVLIDSRLKPQDIDLNFLRQLGEWQVAFNVVFTKADKSNQREVAANAKAFIEAMRADWEYLPQSFITSAIKFRGRKEMLHFVSETNAAFYTGEAE